MTPELIALVDHARRHSPYYRALYRALPDRGWRLADLPPVDPAQYWRGGEDLRDWPVLSAVPVDGHVFKTGGSTSEGRLAVYTRAEWQHFVRAFGSGVARQLRAGDRVANLFFAGDLYTSLLFIHGALAQAPLPLLEYPFSCQVDDAELAAAVERHRIDVLAGVPAQLLRFAHHLRASGRCLPQVGTVLYGGESLFPEQRALLREVLPACRIGSVGCASVDGGLIGYADPLCGPGEHRSFDGQALVEIVDEDSGEPIDEPGRPGQLLVTQLQRRLMPVIRYPSGDRACWREPPRAARRFTLLGRAGGSHRLRIGTLSLFPQALGEALGGPPGLLGWQLHLTREAGLDGLEIWLAADATLDLEALRRRLLERQPAIAAQCASGRLGLRLRQVALPTLRTHPRSGKLMGVVDRRDYAGVEAPR